MRVWMWSRDASVVAWPSGVSGSIGAKRRIESKAMVQRVASDSQACSSSHIARASSSHCSEEVLRSVGGESSSHWCEFSFGQVSDTQKDNSCHSARLLRRMPCIIQSAN